jgi:sulfate adenylyltransferase
VKPHGGALVERVVSGETARAIRARAQRLPHIQLQAHHLASLELLAAGGAAPLRGFMTQREYRSVLDRQRLPGGLLFPLPLVLPVRPGKLGAFPPGSEVALRDERGELRGTLAVTDTFVRDLRQEALLVHGSADAAHPRVALILREAPGALGGEVTLLRERDALFESAREVRLRLARQDLLRVAAGFGAGLPQVPAGEAAGIDALLVRSLDDAGHLDLRLPAVVARGVPAVPWRPGARELLFHALVLKNFGASHLVVAGGGQRPRNRRRAAAGALRTRHHAPSRTGTKRRGSATREAGCVTPRR